MIDVHAHINDNDFDADRNKVIKGAVDTGIKVIIDASIDYESGIASLEISRNYKGIIYTTLGMEPGLNEYKKISELIKKNRENIVGVGEIGMDYYRVKEKRERMAENFRNFIRLAKVLKLPLVIHSRNAGRDTIQILIEETAGVVVMHAFDGKVKDALKGVEHGFYFSFPPSTIHSTQKQQLAEAVPLKNMLLESDAPVLGPERGKRNEPKNIVLTLSKLSEIKQVPIKDLEDITERNAIKVFNL